MHLSKKIAVSFVAVHFVFMMSALYRDRNILSDENSCIMRSDGKTEGPVSLLMISEAYLAGPLLYFESTHDSKFFTYDGTGGPCTYVTFNSEPPYAVALVVTSSAVYYAVGFAIGRAVSKMKDS